MAKFIFITGGVISSLGKGIVSSVLGTLLKASDYTVSLRKLDPYLNVDPGTMNPMQHGEVFVTDDGAETDLDLGHYERFAEVITTKDDNITSGKIFTTLLEEERRGEYLGNTVQVIPHVTNLIKKFVLRENDSVDFIITEIGGTVGDIEAQPYLEAARQIGYEFGREQVLYIHVTFVPYIATSMELKTKPTQHSVKELRAIGIQPDILMCRADRNLTENVKQKIGLFCNIKQENVIEAIDQKLIYEIPIAYHKAGLDVQVLKHFGIKNAEGAKIKKWEELVEKVKHTTCKVRIAIIAKYTKSQDAYKSIVEALKHAAIQNSVELDYVWIDAENIVTSDLKHMLGDVDGILVPGGFGTRGIDGKIHSVRYARENNVPLFGICVGMQVAVIEFSRNVLNISDANSTEFADTKNNVVGMITEWQTELGKETRSHTSNIGGTMRLGAFECILEKGSIANQIYGKSLISERHRHRYEINPKYIDKLEEFGMKITGKSKIDSLAEVLEIPEHKWFVCVQFHPEFKSSPFNPHPLFSSFIATCKAR
ncbi:CTP synthase [Candidatus Lariskella endosymbiont of Epinotia ramella]|uniref:CTP synthase n=1 Tax=Candidatus Lariskella endosymbiont of Epinotia ramella TaxID=3066224 RepID=UPI003977A6BA